MIRGFDEVISIVEGGISHRTESGIHRFISPLVQGSPVSVQARACAEEISDIIARKEAELIREFEAKLQLGIQEAKAQAERQIELAKERRERELVLAHKEAAAREEALQLEEQSKVRSTIRSMTKYAHCLLLVRRFIYGQTADLQH